MRGTTRRNIAAATGETFHILNRGVDKRNIFLDNQDYFRFVHDMFKFNDANPVLNLGYFLNQGQSIDLRNQYIKERKPRKLLVEILAFCLIPNHFHLLLKQREGGGIPKFMRKIGIGYANYFNQKYKRTGTLFQGRYKAILVRRDTHFFHLPFYIHLNPLDLIMPEWREGKIRNYQKAIKILESYRWSSHLDYSGTKNFPSVTQRELLSKTIGKPGSYRKEVKNWLKELNLVKIKNLILE